MSNIGDRMKDFAPKRARSQKDAKAIQRINEERIRKLLRVRKSR